jgi:hypothetical protein
VSNLVTISILQSLVIRCLSTFFNYSSLPHFMSQWALICDTHIPDFPLGERPYGLYKLGLFWFLKIIPNSSPQKQLIQIIPNGEIRNNLSFNFFGFTCFDFLCKILKSENENQASDCMIIGYCEPLVFNIHGYLL